MITDLIYSANGVLPVFLVALVGYILSRVGFLSDNFIANTDKLVFKVMLPCMLFTRVAFTDKNLIIPEDFSFAGFCMISIIALTLLLMMTVPAFIKSKASAGAFMQGVFRSNLAFLGVPFAQNLFGDNGGRLAAMLIACVVPLYNVLAVVVLNIFEPSNSKSSRTFISKLFGVLFGIIKNPLIIAIVLAIPFCFYGYTLPVFAVKTLNYFSDCATPLALITIGASFRFSDLQGRAAMAVSGCFCKLILVPAVMMTIGYALFDFTGVYLGLIMIVFGTPTAVSSYIMAKNMNSDHKLANQFVLLTTLMSAFTVFMWSFVLRRLGLV